MDKSCDVDDGEILVDGNRADEDENVDDKDNADWTVATMCRVDITEMSVVGTVRMISTTVKTGRTTMATRKMKLTWQIIITLVMGQSAMQTIPHTLEMGMCK